MVLSNKGSACQDLTEKGTSAYSRKRIDWIDSLRALAMIFVIYGHRGPGFTGYFVFTSPIKITLFFAITGYVFNPHGSTKAFFYKIFRQLIVPWLVLSIVPYLLLTPIKGGSYLGAHISNILSGKENWYMPACIIAEIMWYYVLKVKKKWAKGVICIVSFIIGILLYQADILDILMINRAMCAIVFIYMGHLFRCYESQIDRLKLSLPLLTGTCIYIGLGLLTLFLYPGENLDVHLNRYYSYPICFAMIIIGLFIVFILAKKIGSFTKGVLLIGQNTLIIYLSHSYIAAILAKVFSLVRVPINPFTNILITVITCAVGTALGLIINRFIPGIMGKKKMA